MVQISVETQKSIVSWFEQVLNEFPDEMVIYRPHPEEKSSEVLKELQDRQPRFRVIGDESVKQWILTCDKIYTWISTSTAEVYAAGKGCTVLRPVEIPYENSMRLFEGAEMICDFDSFRESFRSAKQKFGISEKMIQQYYYMDENKFSYQLVCDAIEQVYSDDKYLLREPLNNPFTGFFNLERAKNRLKRFVARSRFMEFVYNKKWFSNTGFFEMLEDVYYVRDKLKKNYVPDEEIEAIIKKIDKALQ